MNDYHNIPPEDLPFHYNREERLKEASDGVRNNLYSGEKKKRVIIDRRLLIIMIDIVIVVVAFFGITAYQNSKARVGDFEGVKLELSAVEYDGSILAGLKAESLREPEPGTLIEAVFFIDKGVETEVTDLLSAVPGERRILRSSLNPSSESTMLKAHVRIGEKTTVLEKRITAE